MIEEGINEFLIFAISLLVAPQMSSPLVFPPTSRRSRSSVPSERCSDMRYTVCWNAKFEEKSPQDSALETWCLENKKPRRHDF